jgi:hypothetical protein
MPSKSSKSKKKNAFQVPKDDAFQVPKDVAFQVFQVSKLMMMPSKLSSLKFNVLGCLGRLHLLGLGRHYLLGLGNHTYFGF